MPYENNIESAEVSAQQYGYYPYGGYPYGGYPYPYQPYGYGYGNNPGIGGFLFPFLLGALLF